MWPHLFELNIGQPCAVPRGEGVCQLVVRGIEHAYQPDWWCADNPARRTIAAVRVSVEIDGRPAVLAGMPFQLPETVGGLRLYVEATREWACETAYQPMSELQRDVRLSVLDAALPWGPPDLAFPIRDYRWRSSSYNNTWGALVPYNLLYYHRGEDFGAIPDRLPVAAVMGGRVASSPLPGGDGLSNGLSIDAPDARWRYAHMNTESIEPGLLPGTVVAAGEKLALTGCTWSGRRSQENDPHFHLDLRRNGSYVSPYPFLVQAYFNTYPDSAIAAAGGYAFALPGESVRLDASRCVARPGRRIVSARWTLHDGRTLDGERGEVTFAKAGLYAEELAIRTEDGFEARDYLQVRVFDPARGREMAAGWVYQTPARGVRPGQRVLFWNRLRNTTAPVTVDFGDGSEPQTVEREIGHEFGHAGICTVTFSSRGPGEEPVTVKLPVTIEPPG